MTALMKTQGSLFLPIFSRILPEVIQFLQSDFEELQKIGIYIIDDVFEFCGTDSFQYAFTCVPYLLKYCSADSVLVRQPSVYGLGICAKFVASEYLAPFAVGMMFSVTFFSFCRSCYEIMHCNSST